MTEKTSLIDYPCDFSIKIIGTKSATFEEEIRQIIYKHFANGKEIKISTNNSKQNNYLAITATVHVKSQEDLDALYMELTKHPETKMVL